MSLHRTMNLSLLDLGHIEVALEAYIEDCIDGRHAMNEDEVAANPDVKAEYDELGVCVEEGQALLKRVRATMASPD